MRSPSTAAFHLYRQVTIRLAFTGMKNWLLHNKIALAATAFVLIATGLVVSRVRIPGHLDVITAQAMDMSQMRPPTGAAVVGLASARTGSVSDTVTYTGTVQAYNEQDISPRITGVVLSLPVYPGDTVHAGQLVAQLDTAEVGAKTEEALADAQSAQDAAEVAHLTHHLHHQAALDEAHAQEQAAESGLSDAQAEAQASKDSISYAQAAVQSAKANADYWAVEIVREKKLADAGAVSQSDYQSEVAQSQAATSALVEANAKVSEAVSTASADQSKARQAANQVAAADAEEQMARADITIAEGQAQQATATAQSADAAAQEAQVVESYAHITSPTNGVVIDRPISPGTLVQPGTTILKIAEIDRVRVQANVAVADLAGVHPGSLVVLTPQGIGMSKPFLASVTSVFPSANDETHTAVVEAIVPNPGHLLMPGGFVTMRIARRTYSDKLLVPASAVVSENGQSTVWIAQASGPAAAATLYECAICHIRYSAKQAAQYNYKDPMDGGTLVPVASTGAASAGAALKAHQVGVVAGASNGKWTEVTSSELAPGDRVVQSGQAGLTEGVAVTSDSADEGAGQ
jgi:multidrug efflux pump subunit AcrA (membrane-fusion protein)